MKVTTIVGARPQFIKAAMVSRALAKAAESHPELRESIIHTGQHFDHGMSDVFFEEMEIPRPVRNLGVHGLSHGSMTGRMLEAIEKALIEMQPDWVLVYGDTNSTLAGALAAAKLNIPTAHVEAGLRSHNRKMPEEINRVLTDHASTLLFCPTSTAVATLEAEGIVDAKGIRRVVYTGDVMYDSFLFYSSKSRAPGFSLPQRYALATVHRPENTDSPERLAAVVASLNAVSERLPVILPLHPRTRSKLDEQGLFFANGVHVAPTVSYLEMLHLLRGCSVVLTDSGGLQKEAFFQERPYVTLRSETEWTELVELGVNRVTGADPDAVATCVDTFLADVPDWSSRPYGDGNASEIIARSLTEPV